MTTVFLPEEISALFVNAHNDLPTTIGKTYDYDVQNLCQCNFAALQDINLGACTDATGLILSEDDHKAANGNQVFDLANRELEA